MLKSAINSQFFRMLFNIPKNCGFIRSKIINRFLVLFRHFLFFFILLTTQPLASFITASYYENWSQFRPGIGERKPFSPDMIDPHLLTDLYYAFAVFGFISPSMDPSHPHLTGNFTIEPLYPNDQTTLYPQIQELKKRSNGKLRTLLSIGGATFNDPHDPNGIGSFTYKLFSQMVSNISHRKQFIESAIEYAHRFGFDGIDIDWEYPGDLARGGSPEDFRFFLDFLKECYAAFQSAQPPLILSVAMPAVMPSGSPDPFKTNSTLYYEWVGQCSQYLDRLTIMAYNYHTPSDPTKITGPNAPLNQNRAPFSHLSIRTSLDNYLNHGVPAQKILLGIPIYGWAYNGVSGLTLEDNGPGKSFIGQDLIKNGGLMAYFEIADLIHSKNIPLMFDPLTNTAYTYDITSKKWFSFDTPDTNALKVKEARRRQLGGVNFWAIDLDEYQWTPQYPNIRSATLPDS